MTPNQLAQLSQNHLTPDSYFDLNVENGVRRTKAGTRVVTMPAEMILGLHRGLEDETGSAAPIVLYQVGRWWGARFAKRYSADARRFYEADAGDLPLAFYLQMLHHVWALYGWGDIDLSFELEEQGFVRIDVENALYSSVVGNIGRTSDHLTAGILAALVGDLAGRELECAETMCRSKGDATCRFLVGTKGRVDVVQSWLKKERSHDQIAHAIQQGELA